MIDRVVCDVEIARRIEELPGGWGDTHAMGVAIAVIYSEQTDCVEVFDASMVEVLRTRLLAADEIIGFNTFLFDFPVIWGVPRREWMALDGSGEYSKMYEVWNHLVSTSNDLLRRIWQGLGLNPDVFTKAHGGWGLDVVCQYTLGRHRCKSGNGAMAPVLYQQGRIMEVVNYCVNDVMLTRDLARFIETHGYVLGPRGRVEMVPWG